MRLTFEGYSDDTFGECAHFKDDFDNCASGEPIEFSVIDKSTGRGLIVVGQFCPGSSHGWLIGASVYDPEGEDWDYPDGWGLRHEQNSYRGRLVVEIPDGADIEFRCITREAAQ